MNPETNGSGVECQGQCDWTDDGHFGDVRKVRIKLKSGKTAVVHYCEAAIRHDKKIPGVEVEVL